jgi:hypothetical protein
MDDHCTRDPTLSQPERSESKSGFGKRFWAAAEQGRDETARARRTGRSTGVLLPAT